MPSGGHTTAALESLAKGDGELALPPPQINHPTASTSARRPSERRDGANLKAVPKHRIRQLDSELRVSPDCQALLAPRRTRICTAQWPRSTLSESVLADSIGHRFNRARTRGGALCQGCPIRSRLCPAGASMRTTASSQSESLEGLGARSKALRNCERVRASDSDAGRRARGHLAKLTPFKVVVRDVAAGGLGRTSNDAVEDGPADRGCAAAGCSELVPSRPKPAEGAGTNSQRRRRPEPDLTRTGCQCGNDGAGRRMRRIGGRAGGMRLPCHGVLWESLGMSRRRPGGGQ